MKLQKVYQAKDEIDAQLLVGFLEANGVKAFATQGGNTQPLLSGEGRSTVAHLAPRDIFVEENDVDLAIGLIQSVRSN